jgi:hypothetical protein
MTPTDRERELARGVMDGLPLDEPFQQVAWSDSQVEHIAAALAERRVAELEATIASRVRYTEAVKALRGKED